MKPIKEIEIVVGLCVRNSRLLLIQRKDSSPEWDKKWEFPGGKIESHEQPNEAVKREVREETGLEVLDNSFFCLHHHDWDLNDLILRVHIHCYHCQVGEGSVVLENEKTYKHAWTTFNDALKFDSLSANNEILKKFVSCTSIEHGLK